MAKKKVRNAGASPDAPKRMITESEADAMREAMIFNSMGQALGFGQNLGGFSQGYPGNQAAGPQISDFNSGFYNLRWALVSNLRQFLSQMYVEFGLVQTIVDIPVDDALRGGVELKSQQLSEDQILELQASIDRDNDLSTAGQSAKWNRLYGGAGIIILTDQDPEIPLDVTAIGTNTPLEFRSVDMWELFWDKQNTEGYDPSIQSQDFEFYNYYGDQLHKSRVMRMTGLTAPSFIRPRLRGWGFSIIETLIRSMNQYLKATDVTFQILDEAKIDIYKIKNLTSTLLSPIGAQKVSERIKLANWQKNYQNAVVMDVEDDWDHKELSFTGLAETMAGIRMQVASDMRMPLSKLFGISASGFNSGEDDIEVYNAMVESQVRNKIKYDLLRMFEIKCQKHFGFIPDDLTLSFKPLRVMSAEQEENVKTQKFTRLQGAVTAGLISVEEFRDACNKGNLFDVTLDESMDGTVIAPDEDDAGEEEGKDPDKETDDSDPGANRVDSRKSKAGSEGDISKEPPAPKSADAPDAKGKADDAKAKSERTINSPRFDKASYEADGGDAWIDSRRLEFYKHPKDAILWRKAEEASRDAIGSVRPQFAIWWYQKNGGKF